MSPTTGTPIACLPMYDWPETVVATNHFWVEIRDRLRRRDMAAPTKLVRNLPQTSLWTAERLILGQTCGWPYVNGLESQVELVGLLDYGLNRCKPGYYYSDYIVRRDSQFGDVSEIDFRSEDLVIAVNSKDSQSGYRAFLQLLGKDFPISQITFLSTGSHRDSIRKVASGEASFAAIDAMALRLACSYEKQFEGVKVIGRSKCTPGLPLITAKSNSHFLPRIRASVAEAIDAISEKDRATLSIQGLVEVTPQEYDVLRDDG